MRTNISIRLSGVSGEKGKRWKRKRERAEGPVGITTLKWLIVRKALILSNQQTAMQPRPTQYTVQKYKIKGTEGLI